MRDVRLKVVDERRRDRVDRLVPVTLLEAADGGERIVHRHDRQAVSPLDPDVVLRAMWIGVARHHENRVAVRPLQRQRMIAGVDFTAGFDGGWKAVDDDEDAHQTDLVRAGRQRRTDDSAPRY